ncbi:response regulator [Phormidium sp. CLA17]|uniref:response regulator n=1 Tax=Leptolyngbya sp. Cla-17 TaxID=2803751 RepID=UPI001492E8EC|nr:response regulator [Leptolyngbya sp. Cla-17]MBM0740495.1 response regulator [Leptolyngbya sp. Cla-17]
MKAQPNSKPKILVVDDEPDNLDLLYRTFYREFKVLRAENGPAALEILSNEGDVAVIISDQRMPHMSGTEFLSLTATQYPDIIRIILTGYTDVEDLVEAINSGKVFKYVTKPWDDEELKVVVRQAADTHTVLKTRTQELRRSLRQESLLNAVTSTIRSALSYRQILQTIGQTVGHIFETSYCLVSPFQDGRFDEDNFVYVSAYEEQGTESTSLVPRIDSIEQAAHARSTPLRDALFQTIWATQDIQIIQNAGTDDRLQLDTTQAQQLRQAYHEVNIQSSLIVPLCYQHELIAILALHQCGHSRPWQDDEVQLLTMVADQAALTLAQARAYEQLQALAKREALINTITTAIRSSLDPQDIFAAITQQLGQVLRADGCALSLWTETDEYVQCVGLHDAAYPGYSLSQKEIPVNEATTTAINSAFQPQQNSSLDLEDDTRPLPKSVVPIERNPVLRQLMLTKQPVVLNDLELYPEMQVEEQTFRNPTRALLVVPLLSDGKIIGSISLRQNHQPRRWSLSEIELTQAVAAQAAIAVQQARLYQKTRQQAEQLLELDRQKTEFFQNISHEFRTPLTLTIGPLEGAVAKEQGLSYEQSVIALRNSRRLLRLVNQLLDLQRLDAKRMQPSFRPADLVEFVSQTVDSFRAYCDRKDIRLITQLQSCPEAYLDLEKFDKVLYNLLSNAMKFTPTGGSITVLLKPAGDHCLLQVIDTGIGIRPDQIPHLFERFRQAEGSANRSHEGSGLGLALVKELVELHGGQISVDSTYGEGTTFTVWIQTGVAHLPPQQVIDVQAELQPNRAAVELSDIEGTQASDTASMLNLDGLSLSMVQSAASDSTAIHPEDGRVLVVDDNPDVRTYVSSILREKGYQVQTARNGAEGYKTAQAYTPHLIVTDLMMPHVSGLDLIRLIRLDDSLKGVPVILLTAKVDENTRIEGTEQGADAYLSKPFNDRELLAEVRNLLALKANERRVAELNQYLTESVLKRFLPASMVDRAAQGELVLDLRPEPRLVTVLFSDIVGFTQLSNTLRSRRVAELLNEYLAEMTHVIFNNGGTIDKFMGDAILVLFGAPEELSPNEQVRRAIASAREMRRALQTLNQRWQEQGISQVQFRCGIHQGTAVVGMFGSSERSDYTAIGPSVNIAARIQEVADPDCILVSAAVADYLEEDEIVKFSPLELKGIDETVLTFVVTPEPRDR